MSGRPGVGRSVIGGLGVLAGAYGAWLLLSRQDLTQLTSAAIWLAAGVVLHDFVLTPVVLVLVLLAGRALPRHAHAPAVIALVVLGAVSLLAVPVLGTFGSRPDNPTLLDRSYGTGWLVLTALVLVAVVVAAVVRRARHGAPTSKAPTSKAPTSKAPTSKAPTAAAPINEGSVDGPRPGGG